MRTGSWLGVDVGKQSFTVAIAAPGCSPKDWVKMPVQEFPHTPEGLDALVAWVQDHPAGGAVDGICVESSGCWSGVWVTRLAGRLGPVAIVNPLYPKRYGESLGVRDKSDRRDACVLALYGAAQTPAPTPAMPAAYQSLRECVRMYDDFQQDYEAYRQRWAESTSSLGRHHYAATLQHLQQQLAELQQVMAALVAAEPALQVDVQHLTSIPGIGLKTAYVLLAELGDLRAYRRNQLVSYAGLYPRTYQSGTSVYKLPRMVKRGGGRVRKALYMCALTAIRYHPTLRAFYERLLARQKHKRAALGAVMRKLLLQARAVLVQGKLYQAEEVPHPPSACESCEPCGPSALCA